MSNNLKMVNETSNSWYLAQVKNYRLAERNLNYQNFETFLPLQDYTIKSKTKFCKRSRPLFPGYIFVRLELDTSPWLKINNTMGVSRLICQDGVPKKVPLEIVSALISRCDHSGKMLPPLSLERGDPVTVLSGALANFIATVETIESNQRIWVLMDIMGQISRVQLSSKQLNPIK